MFTKKFAIACLQLTGADAGAADFIRHETDGNKFAVQLFESFDEALKAATLIGGPDEIRPNGALPGFLVQIVELEWKHWSRLKWWEPAAAAEVADELIAYVKFDLR